MRLGARLGLACNSVAPIVGMGKTAKLIHSEGAANNHLQLGLAAARAEQSLCRLRGPHTHWAPQIGRPACERASWRVDCGRKIDCFARPVQAPASARARDRSCRFAVSGNKFGASERAGRRANCRPCSLACRPLGGRCRPADPLMSPQDSSWQPARPTQRQSARSSRLR